MNRCGGCRFWGIVPDKEVQLSTMRQCGRVHHDKDAYFDEWRDNFEDSDSYKADEKIRIREIRSQLAVVQDGSGYFAALKCREDFGCVLFEPLNGNPKDSD